jgi:hypothetical protein
MAVNAASQVLLLPLALDEGQQVGVALILVRDKQAVGGALVLLVHAVWDQYGGGRAGQGGDRVLVGGAVNDERENREASQVRAEVGVEDGMPGPLATITGVSTGGRSPEGATGPAGRRCQGIKPSSRARATASVRLAAPSLPRT